MSGGFYLSWIMHTWSRAWLLKFWYIKTIKHTNNNLDMTLHHRLVKINKCKKVKRRDCIIFDSENSLLILHFKLWITVQIFYMKNVLNYICYYHCCYHSSGLQCNQNELRDFFVIMPSKFHITCGCHCKYVWLIYQIYR